MTDPVTAALMRLDLPDPRAGQRPPSGVVATLRVDMLPTPHLEQLAALAVTELETRRAQLAQEADLNAGPGEAQRTDEAELTVLPAHLASPLADHLARLADGFPTPQAPELAADVLELLDRELVRLGVTLDA